MKMEEEKRKIKEAADAAVAKWNALRKKPNNTFEDMAREATGTIPALAGLVDQALELIPAAKPSIKRDK